MLIKEKEEQQRFKTYYERKRRTTKIQDLLRKKKE